MIDVVWFKRDLRIHDHAPLNGACASGGPVLPLYIYEPELWQQPELSGRQFEFLKECLADLESALVVRGAGLAQLVGDAVEVFARIHQRFGIRAIHAHEETGLMWTYARDNAVRAWAKKAGVQVREYRQHGVWRGKTSRSGWAARWDKMMSQPPEKAPPTIKAVSLDFGKVLQLSELKVQLDPCPQRQVGGRREGLSCLESFLGTRGRFYRRAMSNPHDGALACSRISAHLAFGTLSMRETLWAAQRALVYYKQSEDKQFSASISSFIARLHWHCHFIQKLEDQPEIEFENFHPAYKDLRPISPDHVDLATLWVEGRTGFPFVDACMRSLQATGWLNFRMRAMVMSFSSYHLWQDWRLPAQLLARQFTDFEPGIHFSQAQMQSGTTGINTARIYNPIKQSIDQDPNGDFIRAWVPELSQMPTEFVHEPWRAPADLLTHKNSNTKPTTPYPERIVDHIEAAAFARSHIYQVRGQSTHKKIANAIQNKHGSRKSGISATGQKRIAKGKVVQTDTQSSFDF
jgi:deoxyribodipyrimidine photo-lyase